MSQLTELVMILDRSGSMHGLEKDTIGGYNAMLEKQKQEGNQVLVSTVLFNGESTVVHDRVSLSEVSPMTEKDYVPGGSTALVDAMGDAIHHVKNVHKYIRQEDVPAKTLFVMITDGMENASRRYTSDQVKAMVEEQKTQQGWEFIFLGANIDAVETARHYGISEDRAVDYYCDSEGTKRNFEAVGSAVSAMCYSKDIPALDFSSIREYNTWKREQARKNRT